MAEVPFVLRDLVFQDQVRAERVPGQLAQQRVVLVAIVQEMQADW